MDDTTSEELNVDTAVPSFEAYLSAEENPVARETPPTQESPASEPAVDAEADSKPADAEGESPDTEQTEDAAPETPEAVALDPTMKVKVKIGGEEQEVTLEEALKGYSRTADYTRKTQEIAAQRKAQEAEETAVRVERQKYAQSLTQLEQAIQQTLPAKPDWAKLQQTLSPADFAARFAEYEVQSQQMAALREERDKAQAKVAEDHAKAMHQHLQSEHAKLLEALPEWKNPEVAKAEKAKLAAYATDKLGYTEAEIEGIADHRPLLLLHKAMLYDAAQAKLPAVREKINAVRTATPGPNAARAKAAPPSDTTKALQRLAKTGTVDDAAAAFEIMLTK